MMNHHQVFTIRLYQIILLLVLFFSETTNRSHASTLDVHQVILSEYPLILLRVSIDDSRGNPVPGLSSANIRINEGTSNKTFHPLRVIEAPIGKSRICLVIDSGRQMMGLPLVKARLISNEVIRSMWPGDKAAVLALTDQVLITDPLVFDERKELFFSEDQFELIKVINRQYGRGNVALYDGLVKAIRLCSTEPVSGKTILLFSKGLDYSLGGPENSGSRSFQSEDPIREAQNSRISISTFNLGEGSNVDYLQTLARESGGRYVDNLEEQNVRMVLEEILRSLKHQYLVLYVAQDKFPQNGKLGLRVETGTDVLSASVEVTVPPELLPPKDAVAAETLRFVQDLNPSELEKSGFSAKHLTAGTAIENATIGSIQRWSRELDEGRIPDDWMKSIWAAAKRVGPESVAQILVSSTATASVTGATGSAREQLINKILSDTDITKLDLPEETRNRLIERFFQEENLTPEQMPEAFRKMLQEKLLADPQSFLSQLPEASRTSMIAKLIKATTLTEAILPESFKEEMTSKIIQSVTAIDLKSLPADIRDNLLKQAIDSMVASGTAEVSPELISSLMPLIEKSTSPPESGTKVDYPTDATSSFIDKYATELVIGFGAATLVVFIVVFAIISGSKKKARTPVKPALKKGIVQPSSTPSGGDSTLAGQKPSASMIEATVLPPKKTPIVEEGMETIRVSPISQPPDEEQTVMIKGKPLPKPMLVIREPGKFDREMILSQDILNIGRRKTNELYIEDPTVSRIHARLQFRGDSYWIEDLQSDNGTIVNGELVTSPCKLNVGDEIRLGEVVLLLQLKV